MIICFGLGLSDTWMMQISRLAPSRSAVFIVSIDFLWYFHFLKTSNSNVLCLLWGCKFFCGAYCLGSVSCVQYCLYTIARFIHRITVCIRRDRYVIGGRVELLYTTSTANASAYKSHSGLGHKGVADEHSYGITYTVPPFEGKLWRDLGYTIAMRGMFGFGTPLPSHAEPPSEPPDVHMLITYAERLGKRTDFVRVDFMLTAKGWVFIEFTNYPFGGMYTIEPRWLDIELARKWTEARRDKYNY